MALEAPSAAPQMLHNEGHSALAPTFGVASKASPSYRSVPDPPERPSGRVALEALCGKHRLAKLQNVSSDRVRPSPEAFRGWPRQLSMASLGGTAVPHNEGHSALALTFSVAISPRDAISRAH